MHLYCERSPIPLAVTHVVNKNGTLSKVSRQEYGADAIRFVQSSVIMDIGTAAAIRDWLDRNIKL